MDISFRDWVVETSNTTGTSAYSLAGVPVGTSYFTFRQRYSNANAKVSYWVVSADRTKWEKNRHGTLTYGTPDQLSRNVVESTNGDAPVSWVGGDLPLVVYVVPDADAEEFITSMGYGSTRPGVLKFGVWAKEDGIAANFDQLRLYTGVGEDPIGGINLVSTAVTLYGLPPGYLNGLTLSRQSTTSLGIAAGTCFDSTDVMGMKFTSAWTKSVSGAWAAGSGSNGMGNGLTVATVTWYHVFAIINGGVPDFYFDTSPTAANKPTGTTHFRRIGSFRTNASAQITAFVQKGDEFIWETGFNDVAAASNPGTSAITRTLTVPTGVVVWAIFSNYEGNATSNRFVLWTSLDQTDLTPAITAFDINATGSTGAYNGGTFKRKTNTSAQIRYRSSASGASDVTNVYTLGWIDPRGQY